MISCVCDDDGVLVSEGAVQQINAARGVQQSTRALACRNNGGRVRALDEFKNKKEFQAKLTIEEAAAAAAR